MEKHIFQKEIIDNSEKSIYRKHHWLDDTTFTHLYAIAQAAPGPNVLVVTLIGWEVAGLAGALAATLAMCLPMSVVNYLLIDRWESFAGARWQKALSLGVAPLAAGWCFPGRRSSRRRPVWPGVGLCWYRRW